MPTLDVESELEVSATAVRITDEELIVDLEDGRTLSVPLAWYPRLQHGTASERQKFEVGPVGIHWPELDEDISYRGLLLGRGSMESSKSLNFWLETRRQGKKVTLNDFTKAARKGQRKNRKSQLARGR